MKITPTKRGFHVSHTTREVWGVDDGDAEQNTGLCPICGQSIHLTGRVTTNDRLIGSCGDAFTVEQWEANR